MYFLIIASTHKFNDSFISKQLQLLSNFILDKVVIWIFYFQFFFKFIDLIKRKIFFFD